MSHDGSRREAGSSRSPLLVGVLIAASVYVPIVRQHYPSDVVAGEALGVATTLGLYLWYRQAERRPRGGIALGPVTA